MGSGYTYRCESCDYSIEYLQGVGFLFMMEAEEILEDMKSGKLGKHFQTAVNATSHPEVKHSRELYQCSKCGELRKGTAVALYDEMTRERLAFKRHICGKCRSPMHRVDDNSELVCPNCKKQLILAEIFCWD